MTPRPGCRPAHPVALGVVVAYTVVFVGLARWSGYAYEDLFSSTESTLRGAGAAAGRGWGGPGLRSCGGAGGTASFATCRDSWSPRVLWALPAIMLVLAALGLLGTDWSAMAPGHVAAILAAAALVGVTEETLFRGIVLRSLRTGRRGEGAAFAWTSVTFGLFHLSNLALGEWGAPVQTVLTTLIGVGLYLGRRLLGHLAGAVVLHAIWDAASFAHGGYPRRGVADDAYSALVSLFLIAAVAAALIILRFDRRPAEGPKVSERRLAGPLLAWR